MTVSLARLRLDLRNHAVRRDLRDVHNLHRRVMSLFPDGLGHQARQRTGVLFRLDDTSSGPCLLIQAGLEPDPAKLPHGYGTFETRQLQPLLDAIATGMTVHYRLAANATKRLAKLDEAADVKARRDAGIDRPRRHRPVVALTGAAADEWWVRRARDAGLRLLSSQSHPLTVARGVRNDGHRVNHAVTRFDGVAVVTDATAVRKAVLAGIGKGKSYGCGLLSLAPVRDA